MPHAGENSPKVLTFFGDLQIYATFLLIETIAIKMILAKTKTGENPSNWMKSMVLFVKTNSKLGFIMNEHSKKLPEDSTELIENMKSDSSNYEIYKTFCQIVDFILVIVTLIIFTLMFLSLFPKGFLTYSYDPIEYLS